MQKKTQSIVEYIVLLSVVATALTAMSVYIQRATQANLKLMEDQINAEATSQD
jgi:Na+-transporting NADH:ubiquinone oxidoreductase subunit NqrC